MNRHVRARLRRFPRRLLMAAYEGGVGLSPPPNGREREAFLCVSSCRRCCRRSSLRLGRCHRRAGQKTGQVDVVIEYPFLPSLQSPGLSGFTWPKALGLRSRSNPTSAKKWDEVLDRQRLEATDPGTPSHGNVTVHGPRVTKDSGIDAGTGFPRAAGSWRIRRSRDRSAQTHQGKKILVVTGERGEESPARRSTRTPSHTGPKASGP